MTDRPGLAPTNTRPGDIAELTGGFDQLEPVVIDVAPGAQPGTAQQSHFGSKSVPRHLLRGAIGFGSLIGSLALLPVFGPFAVLLAPVGMIALRGCPSCWLMGLQETMSRGRMQRVCDESGCSLVSPHDSPPASQQARSRRGGR